MTSGCVSDRFGRSGLNLLFPSSATRYNPKKSYEGGRGVDGGVESWKVSLYFERVDTEVEREVVCVRDPPSPSLSSPSSRSVIGTVWDTETEYPGVGSGGT